MLFGWMCLGRSPKNLAFSEAAASAARHAPAGPTPRERDGEKKELCVVPRLASGLPLEDPDMHQKDKGADSAQKGTQLLDFNQVRCFLWNSDPDLLGSC